MRAPIKKKHPKAKKAGSRKATSRIAAAKRRRYNAYKSGVKAAAGNQNFANSKAVGENGVPPKPPVRFNIQEFEKAVKEGKLEEYNKKFPLSKDDVFKTNYQGQMVISMVIDNKQLKSFADIMEKNGEPLNRKEFIANDRAGVSGFQRAAGKGELHVVQAILEKDNDKITKKDFLQRSYGSDSFGRSTGGGKTMLHWAAEEKNLKQAAEILAKNGEPLTKADLFTETNDGKSVLRTLAWRAELPTAVEVLAEQGEKLTKDDLLKKDTKGETAFHTAGFNGNIDQVADILNDNGEKLTRAELMHADSWNRTLLHWGTKNKGGLAKVSSILEKGEKPTREDILKEDNEGKNVLAWGVEHGTLDEVIGIMEKGEKVSKADFLSADKKKQTVVHHAVKSKHLDQVVKVLADRGESLKKQDLLKEDNMGMTIYHWGMENANIKQIADLEKLNGQRTTIEDVLEKADMLGQDKRERIFFDNTGEKLTNMYEAELFTVKSLNDFWKATPSKFKTEESKNGFRACQKELREKTTGSLNPLMVKKSAAKGR